MVLMSSKLAGWALNCRLPRGSKQKCIICQLIICLVLVPSNHARYWPWYRVRLSSVLFFSGCARQFAGRDDSNPYLCSSRRNVVVRRRKRGDDSKMSMTLISRLVILKKILGNLCESFRSRFLFYQSCTSSMLILRKEIYPRKFFTNLYRLIF